MQKCKEIFFKNDQYTTKYTNTHTHIHTYAKMQNRFIKTKCKKRSIALKIENDFQNRQTYYSYTKKNAQILNIYIRIIALIRKGMDVAAEMVIIKNLL